MKIPKLYSERMRMHLALFHCPHTGSYTAQFIVTENESFPHIPEHTNNVQINDHGDNCFEIAGLYFSMSVSLDERIACLSVSECAAHTGAIIFSAFKWFVMYLAICDGGLPLHSSLICHDGEGMLFCGQSGKGKSTIHTILSSEDESVRGSDEVNIVFLKDKELIAYPTPFKSSGSSAGFSHGVSVRDVFFIEHSGNHWIKSLKRQDAVYSLLKSVFHYSGPGILTERIMDTVLLISSLNIFSELWFKNDSTITGFLLRLHGKELCHVDAS